MRDPRFDVAATLLRGYRHHAIRFTRWRDDHPRLGDRINEVYQAELPGQQARQFVVARETLPSGACWWHVYRRLNPNPKGKQWRWLAQLPHLEEAAAYIDDVQHGRTRVGFGGIGFHLQRARSPQEIAADRERGKPPGG